MDSLFRRHPKRVQTCSSEVPTEMAEPANVVLLVPVLNPRGCERHFGTIVAYPGHISYYCASRGWRVLPRAPRNRLRLASPDHPVEAPQRPLKFAAAPV